MVTSLVNWKCTLHMYIAFVLGRIMRTFAYATAEAESSLICAAYATVQIPHYAKFSQMRGNSSPGTILRLCIIILYIKDQTKMYRICTYI